MGAKVGVSVGLSAWLLARMLQRDGADALADRLGTLDARWLLAAVALHALAVLTGVLRWRVLLRAAGLSLPLAWLARSFLIGRFIGAFTPSTTGLDGWRLFDVGRRTGALGESTAVIVVEKLVGLVGMALVCAALAPIGGAELLGPSAIGVALALALGAMIGLALMRRPALVRRLAALLPRRLAPKVIDSLAQLRLELSTLGSATLLGVLSHLALSAVFWATAGALGLEVDAWTLLTVGNAIVLAVLLPVSVGGVGVREGVAVMLLATASVASTDAVLVALLGYLTGQVPALIGGALFALDKRAPAETQRAPVLGEQTVSPSH
jgi:uncharacterized membrane protein YbhN (UPF0104 family)